MYGLQVSCESSDKLGIYTKSFQKVVTQGVPVVAQRVKDPALLKLWHRYPCPGNFHMLFMWQKKKKKKKSGHLEFFGKANSWIHPKSTKSETFQVGPNHLCLSKFSVRLYKLKLENHCPTLVGETLIENRGK